ncbi:unnamed protein product [Fusarium equiseti]|uniref:Uncharacterized protein n=1 Tax=Fusarium equiseti TaxID=61235 RepID=A0A8J2NPL9_FUSEQ|nr:unnamed protein product [Fusarium equiseti]
MSSTEYNRIPTVEEASAIASTTESSVTLIEDDTTNLWSPVYKRTQPEVSGKPSFAPTVSEEPKRKEVALPSRKSTSSSSIQQAVIDSLFCIPALDTAGSWSNRGLVDPGGESRLSAINDAFISAISSPPGMKSASSDAFGNVKIPMIESLTHSNISRDHNGWYAVEGRKDFEYSSLSGLPIRFGVVLRSSGLSISNDPWGFEFESFHGEGVTKATCGINTTHVEANISCWRKDCTVDHIRQIQKVDSNYLTVLHRPGVIDYDFFSSFVNATSDNLGSQTRDEFIHPSPLECYLINPSFPYAWTAPSTWTAFAQCATDRNRPPYMWDISDTLFSQRMTQLLNTF